MDFTPELENKCLLELRRICDKDHLNINIPSFKLSAEKQPDERLGDHHAIDNSIVVYCLSHNTESQLLETVRHEARHVWQHQVRGDVYDWWMKDHHDLYILIHSHKELAEKFLFYCVVELDAEDYAKTEINHFLPRHDKTLEALVPNIDIVEPQILAHVQDVVGFHELSSSGQAAYFLIRNKYTKHV